MSDPTPTPIPPTPTNWPKLLTDLWSFPLVRQVGVGGGLVVLGMVLQSWFFDGKPVPQPQPPVIAFEKTEYHAQPGQYVTVSVATNGRTVKWKADPRLQVNPEALANPKAKQLMAPTPGKYWICAYTAVSGWLPYHAEPTDPTHTVFIVDGPIPPPEPPTPPIPPVPPVPPGTYEGPLPASATEMATLLGKMPDQIKVLIVYDVTKALPPAQYEILMGSQVRTALAAKGQFRIWDKSVNASNETKDWQDMLAKTQGKTMPWLVISK